MDPSKLLTLDCSLKQPRTASGNRYRELSHRDAMIAATARSTGDEYVVADRPFETEPLDSVLEVTNLHAGE